MPSSPNPERSRSVAWSDSAGEVGSADPQKRRTPRNRVSLQLAVTRLEADVRSLGLGLELALLTLAKPGLMGLVLQLLRAYPPGSAHRIARDGGDLVFGETPLATADRILERAGVRSGQRLVDLGCGPGRLRRGGAARLGRRPERLLDLGPTRPDLLHPA